MTNEEVIEAGRLIADMRNVLTVLTGTTDADKRRTRTEEIIYPRLRSLLL